jgi:4-hydroxy-L-threonine phosphate dehydrogenase PdxA
MTGHDIGRACDGRPLVAIAAGDVAGVGPEISIKAALAPAVRAVCRPLIVCDPEIIARHIAACGIAAAVAPVHAVAEAGWHGPDRHEDWRAAGQRSPVLNVLACPAPEAARVPFGVSDAASGRAALAFCRTAIRAALANEVHAVVAAPQNQTAIALAGISFDGYPSFVARETGHCPDDVYLMLCFEGFRIVHATLHQSVRQALAMLSRRRVGHAIATTDRALRRLGVTNPRICVGGLNPHAGEGGLFGREEIDIIGPAVADATAQGIAVTGPLGTDTMLHRRDVDAFLVMLHDQGHIAAKLLARNATAGLAIGSPILFSSVAHGSAHDIAGKGLASPEAMIAAIRRLAGAAPSSASQGAHAVP